MPSRILSSEKIVKGERRGKGRKHFFFCLSKSDIQQKTKNLCKELYRISEQPQQAEYRGGEQGGKDTVEGETETGIGAILAANLHSRRGSHGVGGGPHGEPPVRWDS